MKLSSLALFLAMLVAQNPVFSQEGFPMDGTWRGEWEAPGSEGRTMVVIVMSWDGAGINGIINPGRNSFPIKKASLDPENWSVEVEATSREGKEISISGTLAEIGAYNREVNGILTIDGNEYPFHMVRE